MQIPRFLCSSVAVACQMAWEDMHILLNYSLSDKCCVFPPGILFGGERWRTVLRQAVGPMSHDFELSPFGLYVLKAGLCWTHNIAYHRLSASQGSLRC